MTRFIAEFSRDVSLVLFKQELNGKSMGNRSWSGNNHEKQTYVGNRKPTVHFEAHC